MAAGGGVLLCPRVAIKAKTECILCRDDIPKQRWVAQKQEIFLWLMLTEGPEMGYRAYVCMCVCVFVNAD